MGNSLGGKKSAKVMKISGETIKLKTPARAGSVLVNYPGHVLLESEAVKQNGMRAKPLEPQEELKPRRLYFLVELPKVVIPPPSHEENNNNNNNKFGARRVRSGIQMSAKDRLESLRLARRSSSDLNVRRPPPVVTAIDDEKMGGSDNGGGSGVRVRMRLPKAEVERLMAESQDGAEAAEKIARLCMESGGADAAKGGVPAAAKGGAITAGGGAMRRSVKSTREKRVGFMPSEREIHQLTASS